MIQAMEGIHGFIWRLVERESNPRLVKRVGRQGRPIVHTDKQFLLIRKASGIAYPRRIRSAERQAEKNKIKAPGAA